MSAPRKDGKGKTQRADGGTYPDLQLPHVYKLPEHHDQTKTPSTPHNHNVRSSQTPMQTSEHRYATRFLLATSRPQEAPALQRIEAYRPRRGQHCASTHTTRPSRRGRPVTRPVWAAPGGLGCRGPVDRRRRSPRCTARQSLPNHSAAVQQCSRVATQQCSGNDQQGLTQYLGRAGKPMCVRSPVFAAVW